MNPRDWLTFRNLQAPNFDRGFDPRAQNDQFSGQQIKRDGAQGRATPIATIDASEGLILQPRVRMTTFVVKLEAAGVAKLLIPVNPKRLSLIVSNFDNNSGIGIVMSFGPFTPTSDGLAGVFVPGFTVNVGGNNGWFQPSDGSMPIDDIYVASNLSANATFPFFVVGYEGILAP